MDRDMDASLRRWINYADEVTLSFAFVELPGKTPVEVWMAKYHTPTWERDWLIAQAEKSLPERTPGHALEVRYTHLDWGADGAAYSVLLEVTQMVLAGAFAAATYDGLKALFARLRERDSSLYPAEPVTRQEAAERAKWFLSEAYELGDTTDLRLVSEDRDIGTDTWEFGFRLEGRGAYTVTLGLIDGAPNVSRIRRELD